MESRAEKRLGALRVDFSVMFRIAGSRTHVARFHLYEMCRTGKSTETESGFVVAKGWGGV